MAHREQDTILQTVFYEKYSLYFYNTLIYGNETNMDIKYYSIDINEYDHFRWHAEDAKHGLYIVYLNDNIEQWIDENIEGKYEIEYDTYFHHSLQPTMTFENEEDAIAFKLRWI